MKWQRSVVRGDHRLHSEGIDDVLLADRRGVGWPTSRRRVSRLSTDVYGGSPRRLVEGRFIPRPPAPRVTLSGVHLWIGTQGRMSSASMRLYPDQVVPVGKFPTTLALGDESVPTPTPGDHGPAAIGGDPLSVPARRGGGDLGQLQPKLDRSDIGDVLLSLTTTIEANQDRARSLDL